MNPGQTMFHNFFMNLVQPGKEAQAEALLAEGFARQDAGTFDAAYLARTTAQYIALVRPECIEQLKQAMAQFAKKL